MKKNDLLIIFSNSGNNLEILNIINLLKNIELITIGIFCNKEAKIMKFCNYFIINPLYKKLDGNINLIPTNSIMSNLIFCNILVSILKKDINIDEYKKNHISGSIGINLKKIKDILIEDCPKIIIEDNNKISIKKILLKMTMFNMICFFVNNKNNLLEF